MATTKKTTKKSPAKRFVTAKEYDDMENMYYRLKRKAYDLANGGKLNETAQEQMKKFVKALEKARSSVNWYRATNYARG